MPDEAGWYRLAETGWQRVSDAEAEAEIAARRGWDLVHVNIQPAEEITLW